MLPEIFNSNAHIRSVADGYAADGFLTLAPDVYWRQEAGSYLPYTDEGRGRSIRSAPSWMVDQFTMTWARLAMLRGAP